MPDPTIDYSKKSWTSSFIHEGCKYSVSFIEDYYGFEDGIGETGKFIVVATAARGTHICYFHKDVKDGEWTPDDKNFLHLISLDYFHFIQDELSLHS